MTAEISGTQLREDIWYAWSRWRMSFYPRSAAGIEQFIEIGHNELRALLRVMAPGDFPPPEPDGTLTIFGMKVREVEHGCRLVAESVVRP